MARRLADKNDIADISGAAACGLMQPTKGISLPKGSLGIWAKMK
ncbi:hypothetical protein ACEN2J_04550 [Pseudorhodobacter sp. W20_MBD10_FR17]